jgi:hypothetical protein
MTGTNTGVYFGNTALPLWGMLVSMTIYVRKAYTGTQPTLNVTILTRWCSQTSTPAFVTYQPVVDLKTAGARVITPMAITGSVGADSLGSAPGAVWSYAGWNVQANHDTSGESLAAQAIFDLIVQLDQGITAIRGINYHNQVLP